MGVPTTHYVQININGHVVICAVTKNTSCSDVIKMAAVQSAQNATNLEMFVRHEGIEKKIAKNSKLLKIVRSFGVGSTNYAIFVRPAEKNDSKSNLAVTACKALKKLLVLKNFLVKKQTEATDITSNNTMNANLNNTANTKARVDNTKNMNALLNDTNQVTLSPSIRARTSLPEYDTSIMSGSGLEYGLSDCQSRSVLNNAFIRDRRIGMNRAFIESLMDSVYMNDDSVQDLFNQCRLIDEDEDVAATYDGVDAAVSDVAAYIVVTSHVDDVTDSMSDSSEDGSLDELEMNIEDDITGMDVNWNDETREVSATLVLSWVNSVNLG